MKRPALIIIFLSLIVYGCKHNYANNTSINGTRNLTIFFDPSHDAQVEKYPLKGTLDGVKILDTIVTNTHINSSLSLGCIPIDTGSKNIFELTILGKSTKIHLNNYHHICINVFSYYDNRTIIREMFQEYTTNSIKTSGVIPDYKTYLAGLMAAHPGNKYDSICVYIDTKRCLCDSD
jgi:hypothetical protein